jgi:hypothetical protein
MFLSTYALHHRAAVQYDAEQTCSMVVIGMGVEQAQGDVDMLDIGVCGGGG